MAQPRPLEILAKSASVYPNAWSFAGKALPDLPTTHSYQIWKEFCIAPMAFWGAVATEFLKIDKLSLSYAGAMNDLAALGAWRLTQGIYNFDDALAEELTKSVFDATIPVEVLKRLPEWCIYIKVPENCPYPMYGFFAFLDYEFRDEKWELG